MSVPVALQLYSIRDYTAKDMIGSLEKVKEAGYDAVEFAGYGNLSAGYLRKELDRIGLIPLSSHVDIFSLEKDLDSVLAYSLELGLKYVVCPHADMSNIDAINKTAEIFNRVAEVFNKNGIQLGYHNHAHEFDLINGKYALDIMLEKTSEYNVFAEIDTYWVKYAGVDPLSYIKSIGNRMGLYHFKDILLDNRDKGVAVGEGDIDFSSIVKYTKETGIGSQGIIVEQESFDEDPFESLARSCKNIRKMLGEV